MIRQIAVFAMIGWLAVVTASHAQVPAPPQSGDPAQVGVTDQLTAYQRAQIDIEQKKLSLEAQKLAVERAKNRWTALSIAVPLVAALIAFLAGMITMIMQARAQFNIKAAELVLASYSPGAAQQRARLLVRMFPRWLNSGFASSFAHEDFPGVRLYEMKVGLFEALCVKDADADRVIRNWFAVFPEERERFKTLLTDVTVPPTATGTTQATTGRGA